MTKEELIAPQRAAKHEEKRFSIFWLIFFFTVLIGNLPLSKWVDHHRSAAWIQILFVCLLFGFLFGNVGFLLWITKRRNRKFGLLCPVCGQALTQITGQIAVATGFCGHCGGTVFER